MNIDSKKTADLVMNLPFALPFAGMTLILAEKIAVWSEYGQLSVPATADYNSLTQALLYRFFAFLGLLGIPRAVLYFKGATKKRWTFLFYWGLPFALAFVLPDRILDYALLAIATFAWTEVLMVFDPFGKLFPPPPTKR